MELEHLKDILYVVAFFLGGLGFALVMVTIPRLLAPRSREAQSLSTYECGVAPIGGAWIRFGIVYYLYALIFLAFAVDVIFLFPVAVIYAQEAIYSSAFIDFIVVFLFIDTLALAVVYAWKKGVFEWQKTTFNKQP